MEKEGTPLIVSDNNKYRLHRYKSEEELEKIAIKHATEIFGEDTTYLDIKKKMTSIKGISGIPDGFMIDFKRAKCYIIEVELSTHDIIRHIANQIFRFKVALNNNTGREELAKAFYDKLVEDNLKSRTSLSDIKQVVNNQFGIVIIIDDVSEQLAEIVNVLSQDGMEVIAVPFETYVDANNNFLYRFTTFTKEALEKEAKKWTFKWTTVPVENHLDKTGSDLKKVFSQLSRQICSLPKVKEKSRKNWITYQTSPLKNFCTVKVLSDCLEVNIKCDDSFKDEKGIAKKIKRTPAWTFDRVFTIKPGEDIDQFMYLIRQAYDCTCANN